MKMQDYLIVITNTILHNFMHVFLHTAVKGEKKKATA